MSTCFFTDRDLGKQFPSILAQAGLRVQRHDDHFSADTRDEDWLHVVGERGWVAITHDQRIRYKPNEIRAVIANRVALLVVVGHAPFADLALCRFHADLAGDEPGQQRVAQGSEGSTLVA